MYFGIMSETEREMSSRERFFKKLMESVEGKKDNYYNIITKDAYDSLLKEVEDAISATKKTSAQYRRIKRFNVLEFGDTNPRRASQILFADGRHF